MGSVGLSEGDLASCAANAAPGAIEEARLMAGETAALRERERERSLSWGGDAHLTSYLAGVCVVGAGRNRDTFGGGGFPLISQGEGGGGGQQLAARAHTALFLFCCPNKALQSF